MYIVRAQGISLGYTLNLCLPQNPSGQSAGTTLGMAGLNALLCMIKGHQVLSLVRSRVVHFMFGNVFLKIFFTSAFLFGANFQDSFQIYWFPIFHKHKKWRRPLLYQLFIKAVHISTMWTQTKWSWALWLTNDKASYVAKEDSICVLSVAKEATLNEQRIKPGVPLFCDKTCIFDGSSEPHCTFIF